MLFLLTWKNTGHSEANTFSAHAKHLDRPSSLGPDTCAETLPEVEAEQAQRVASLSKVLLWVPGGRAQGGPVPLLSHRAPAGAAQSTQERRRGGRAARLRWERSLSVRQAPLLRHPYVTDQTFLNALAIITTHDPHHISQVR